jgi:hypothetical protein
MKELYDMFPNYSLDVDIVLMEFNLDLPKIVVNVQCVCNSDSFEVSLKDKFVEVKQEDGSFVRPGLRLKLNSLCNDAARFAVNNLRDTNNHAKSKISQKKQREAIAECWSGAVAEGDEAIIVEQKILLIKINV